MKLKHVSGIIAMLHFPLAGGFAAYGSPEPGSFEPCTTSANDWLETSQVTVVGRIEDVLSEMICNIDRERILQLKVSSHGRTFLVNLAPGQFLRDKGLNFAIGEEVTVKGLVYDVEGEKTIAVAEVQQYGSSVRLRNKAGTPLWMRPKIGVREHEEQGRAGF